MKVSHKVKNLHGAVEEFRKQGFTVEYGRAKNPYNASSRRIPATIPSRATSGWKIRMPL